ncbi:hypothetical protein D3C87_1841950 [compost metagenome]
MSGAVAPNASFYGRNLRRHASARLEQHQVFRRDTYADLSADQMIDMAREDRFQLRAGRQLQAIER